MLPVRARYRLRYLPLKEFPWVECPLLMSGSFQIFAVGEGDDKFRTAAFAGLYPSAAAMAFRNLPNDGKPRAGPLDLSANSSLKQLKYALCMFRRNPRT